MTKKTAAVFFLLSLLIIPAAAAQDSLSDFGIAPAPDGAQAGDQVQGDGNQDLVVIGDPHAQPAGGAGTGAGTGSGTASSGNANTPNAAGSSGTPPQGGGLPGHPGFPSADHLRDEFGGFPAGGDRGVDRDANPQFPTEFDNTHDAELGELWRKFNRGEIDRDEYIRQANEIRNPDQRVGLNDGFGDDLNSGLASANVSGRGIHAVDPEAGQDHGPHHDHDD